MFFVFWLVMEVVNCMNGLGDELLGGENVNGLCWVGNFDLLLRFKCLGVIDLFVWWIYLFILVRVFNRLDLNIIMDMRIFI